MAGFLLDFGEDGSGMFMKFLRRGSGLYIDTGASDLVADGEIKLKSGVNVDRIKERSVMLSDGTELPADLIVYATGYAPMNDWVAKLISPEIGNKVGACWGLGSSTNKDPGPWEGELRNMWKPTNQPTWIVVSWRDLAAMPPLLAILGIANQSPHGTNPNTRLLPLEHDAPNLLRDCTTPCHPKLIEKL